MKSINTRIKKVNNRGVLGLDTAKEFVLAIMVLAVIAFATIVALSSLNNSNAVTGQAATDTTAVLQNVTAGTVTLFSNAGTWFSLLAVVIIILIIAVVIFAVNRFGTGRGGGL